MMIRFDESTIPQHRHLLADDHCYYFYDYTPRGGYHHSEANSFINNLKKPVSKRNLPEWQYKEGAINKAASMLSGINWNDRYVIPVPPSLVSSDINYDSRLTDILSRVIPPLNWGEVVIQTESYEAAHLSSRQTPDQLYGRYRLADGLSRIEASNIVIFDDVITTGSHYRAMHRFISESFPGKRIAGLFLARTIRQNFDMSQTFSGV